MTANVPAIILGIKKFLPSEIITANVFYREGTQILSHFVGRVLDRVYPNCFTNPNHNLNYKLTITPY